MDNNKRVLLKLSGESLAAGNGYGIDPGRLSEYAAAIAEASKKGFQIAIVIGGGNIFRGMQGVAKGFDRVTGDSMGMLATMINSLALRAAIEAEHIPVTLFTAHSMGPIGRIFKADEVKASLEAGAVAILSGGTGNPFFTTDSAAALRAAEIGADYLIKGTRVDGVYTADPEKDPAAKKYAHVSFREVYEKGLKIMDLTAMTLCQENNIPILVFNMDVQGNLLRLLEGDPICTRIDNEV